MGSLSCTELGTAQPQLVVPFVNHKQESCLPVTRVACAEDIVTDFEGIEVVKVEKDCSVMIVVVTDIPMLEIAEVVVVLMMVVVMIVLLGALVNLVMLGHMVGLLVIVVGMFFMLMVFNVEVVIGLVIMDGVIMVQVQWWECWRWVYCWTLGWCESFLRK